MSLLINAAQLDRFRKAQKNIAILDATWYLPSEQRRAEQEFLTEHISGARFFDLNAFHDQHTALPHMLIRDEQAIADKLGALGLTNEHKIIIYDNSELHTSCRAFWMLKVFGHSIHQMYILDGGLAAWKRYGGKLETGSAKNIAMRNYKIDFIAHYIRTLVQMKTNLHHPTEQVIDARHPLRYAGGKELRPGIRPGHLPGSFCFPYLTMFESNGCFRPIERIRKQLMGIGIDWNSPIVTMCGSGITAAIVNFVLDAMDVTSHALYDGSWSEWGAEALYDGEESLAERPIVTSLDT